MEVTHTGVTGILAASHAAKECRLALAHARIPNQQTEEETVEDQPEKHENVTWLVVQVKCEDLNGLEKLKCITMNVSVMAVRTER